MLHAKGVMWHQNEWNIKFECKESLNVSVVFGNMPTFILEIGLPSKRKWIYSDSFFLVEMFTVPASKMILCFSLSYRNTKWKSFGFEQLVRQNLGLVNYTDHFSQLSFQKVPESNQIIEKSVVWIGDYPSKKSDSISGFSKHLQTTYMVAFKSLQPP